MSFSLAFGLFCLAATTGEALRVKMKGKNIGNWPYNTALAQKRMGEAKGKFAYVTMYIHPKKAAPKPQEQNNGFHWNVMTEEQEDKQMKVWEADRLAGKSVPHHYHKKVAEKKDKKIVLSKINKEGNGDTLNGCAGCKDVLRMAERLRLVQSDYPLVVITNMKELLMQDPEVLKSQNIVIKQLAKEDYLKRKCQIEEQNKLHFQKLMIFNMTQYDKMIWMDADIRVMKNVDYLFEDTEHEITGQFDDFTCDGKAEKTSHGFCSGVMRFNPSTERFNGLMEYQSKMKTCWGDQEIISEYFRTFTTLFTFPKSTVAFDQCSKSSDLVHRAESWSSHDR